MNKKKKPKNDLTGQKFGHLEVIRMDIRPEDKRREYKAVCKCHNCGKEEHWVFPYHLKKIGVISCGCLQGNRKTGKNRHNYDGYEQITGSIWGKIKRSAERRSKIFSITIEDAWNLFLKQDKKCALSQLPIEMGKGRKMGTASLDRINSNKGYTIDNIQWVHRNVNIIKHSCSQEYFITICRKIVDNESLKDIQSLTDEQILSNKLFAKGF